jgi:hypothetical protein
MSSQLARTVTLVLIGCEAAAVAAVAAALLAEQAAGLGPLGAKLALAGVVALLAGPFVALLNIAASSLRRRPGIAVYAAATMAAVALGIWLAA